MHKFLPTLFVVFSVLPFVSYAFQSEVILGKKDAPVTVIEYSSLSCGGCAYFAEKILPTLEKEYVDTGKIRLIIRQIVMAKRDLQASMLVCCAPDPHKLQLAYWKHQAQWTQAKDDSIVRNLAKDHGMTDAQIDDCLKDEQLRKTLFSKKLVALKGYKIEAIPTVIIQDKPFEHTENIDDFRKAVDQALKEAHTQSR